LCKGFWRAAEAASIVRLRPGQRPSRFPLRYPYYVGYIWRFRADVRLSAFPIHLIATKGGTQT